MMNYLDSLHKILCSSICILRLTSISRLNI
nr:MAG TPA: hypothetical protein [Caudoviricetes sp.]